MDDAHGIGVTGDEGRGSCWRQQVKPELLIVTFGKGFGVSGAAILCSESVADYLLQFARHLIYSTSMPPAQAQALSAALAVIRSPEGADRREKLAALIQRFRSGVKASDFTLANSHSAIQPLIVGDNARAFTAGGYSAGTGMLGERDPTADRSGRYCPVAPDAHSGA